jgi:hypothetical protein
MPFVIDAAHIPVGRHVMTSGVTMAAAGHDLVLGHGERALTDGVLQVTITAITRVLDILHRRLECGIDDMFAWKMTAVMRCICKA